MRPDDATSSVKAAAHHELTRHAESLVALSHRLHAHPELGFEEELACSWLADELAGHGFVVERGVCELPTAWTATAGTGPLVIGICAEYDALPGIGHACGHNVIAAAAAGAGLALARVADDLGITVKVIGTPAEENGGGKALMLARGGFDGVHAAMMVHPAPHERLAPAALARAQLQVEYEGRPAHASAAPEDGINAADALTVAQVAIGLLRQHIPAGQRIHGIITEGGQAANVVPAHTEASYYLRAANLAELQALDVRVRACFEAGAVATGARLTLSSPSPAYTEFRHDPDLVEAYGRNAVALGRVFPVLTAAEERMIASTDMGNVSLAIPAIQPLIDIGSGTVGQHQAEFAAFAIGPAADRALLEGAAALAWTAVDAALDRRVRDRLLTG
ncbi:MAG TPA: amidohydrolase [Streptosporangiaceae bacterium]|nr:amidohydrolase [Streptosporangiaceae bacterium]